jgi:hypothetical protein
MSRARIFEWHKRFSGGRESVRDHDHPGYPHTSVTANNTEKVQDVLRKDCRLDVRAIAEVVNLDRESVQHILTKELNMKKVCKNGSKNVVS